MFYLDSRFDFNFLFVDVEYNFVNTKKQQAQYVGTAFKTIPELEIHKDFKEILDWSILV